MPRRALVERRPWLLGSLAAAIAYYLLRDAYIGGLYLIGWKGAAVGLLAIYAVLRHSSTDARLLAGAMALSASADMTLELYPALALLLFFASYLFGLALFLRNRRQTHSGSQKAAAMVLLLLTPFIAFLLTAHDTGVISVTLYALALGGMAASAWTSRFPRYRVGIGAVLLVAAKLLQLAGMGPLSGQVLPELLAWPLYYAAQFLICTGVIQTLRHDTAR